MANPNDIGGQGFLELPKLPTTEQQPLVPTEDLSDQIPDISKAVEEVPEVKEETQTAQEVEKRQSWWRQVIQDTLNERSKRGGCGCF